MSNRKQRRANKNSGKALDPLAKSLFEQAVQHHRAGQLEDAERLYRTLLTSQPGHADSLYMMGLIVFKRGDYRGAADLIEHAIRIKKNDPFCHFNLGNCYRLLGRLDDAVREYKRATTIKPDYSEAFYNLGNMYRDLDKLDDAIICFVKALVCRPDYAEAMFNLGGCLQKQGRFKDAEAQYRAALEINPSWPDALYNAGILYLKMEWPKYEAKGREYLNQVVTLDPHHENAWINLVRLYERAGDDETAEHVLDRALKHLPQSFELAVISEKIRRRKGIPPSDTESIVELANRMLEANSASVSPAIMVDIAQMHDSAGDIAAAFKWFSAANTAKKRIFAEYGISSDTFPALIDGYRRSLLSVPEWPKAPPLPAGMANPVFLVGFPRSGTTLLDQIFDSHPQIEVAEENPVIQRIGYDLAASRGKPQWDMLKRLESNEISVARERYMSEMKEFGCTLTPDSVFIDKNPFNMVYAPLILRLFPNARFLLALRHPCDAVLSNFMQHFVPNEAVIHMTDLRDAARIYDRIFSAWDDICNVLHPAVHIVKYENVISDMKLEIKGALEFLSLPWDDEVLNFDRTAKERNIRTPSRTQVTKKIYASARGRWHRYREFMGDVPEILRPWSVKFGYETD